MALLKVDSMKVHARLRLLAAKSAAAPSALVRFFLNPLLIAFALVLLGVGALVSGVFILFGQGVALIVGGVLAMIAGLLLVRGVNNVQ
jgi:hypothetical protein